MDILIFKAFDIYFQRYAATPNDDGGGSLAAADILRLREFCIS